MKEKQKEDTCKFCGCELLEHVSGCNCPCHPVVERLVQMNHGDRAKTLREIKEEMPMNPFPGMRFTPSSVNELIDLLKKVGGENVEVVKVSHKGEPNPRNMSIPELIKYETYIGKQKGRLASSFTLDPDAQRELEFVLSKYPIEARLESCIAYLAGYDRGMKYDMKQKWGW